MTWWQPSDRALWLLAFTVFAASGVLWALVSPPLSGPDEPSHVIRAAALGHGELLGTTERVRSDEPGGLNATFTTYVVPEGWGRTHDLVCFKFRFEQPADCLGPLPAEGEDQPVVTSAGTYQPAYYAAVGWVAGPLDIGPALRTMRSISALLGAALLASAAVTLRRLRHPVAGVALLAAATPTSIYLLGMVNPNGVEVAGAVLFWAASLLLAGWTADPHRAGEGTGADRRVLLGLVAGAGALAWARPSGIFLLPLAAAVVGLLAFDRTRVSALTRDPGVRRAGASIVVLWLGSVAWVVAVGSLDALGGLADPELTAGEIVRTSWGLTGQRLESMVGVFGWLDTFLPDGAWQGWVAVWVALLGAALVAGTRRQRAVLTALVVGILVLPIVMELRTARSVGFAWQGRYSLALTVGVPLASAWVLGVRRSFDTRGARAAAAVVLVALASVHVVSHVASMRRYALGAGEPLLAYLVRPGWTSPLGDVGGLALALLTAAGLFAVGWLVSAPSPSARAAG